MNPDKFKKWLDSKGLTRKEAAEKMGRKERHIYSLLSGEYKSPNWKEVENFMLAYEFKSCIISKTKQKGLK